MGNDVHNINVLTVIASESYENFAKGLQEEIAEAVADRPRAVTAELFIGKVFHDSSGSEQTIDDAAANSICFDMITNGYVDRHGALTDKYYEDKKNNAVVLSEENSEFISDIIHAVDLIYDSRSMQPENARKNNIELHIDDNKLAMSEFKALWSKINAKTAYTVNFETAELIQKAINALDSHLRVPKIYFKIETGEMSDIKSKNSLQAGEAFVKSETDSCQTSASAVTNVKYDLIGKLVSATGLTRKTVAAVLKGIQKPVFDQFKNNPEEFIIKAAAIINDEKAAAVIEHITYNILEDRYDNKIFTDCTIKGQLGINAMKTKRHLYDHVIYDSEKERKFAEELDTDKNVAVYVKLPNGFYISTPVGHYNPDWAIAFYEGTVKHIYFVAETKGSMKSMQLRDIEKAKIHCAKVHFSKISNENVVYEVVDSYKGLFDIVSK